MFEPCCDAGFGNLILIDYILYYIFAYTYNIYTYTYVYIHTYINIQKYILHIYLSSGKPIQYINNSMYSKTEKNIVIIT